MFTDLKDQNLQVFSLAGVAIIPAPVDHRNQFQYVNISRPGGCHDASVYGASKRCTTM